MRDTDLTDILWNDGDDGFNGTGPDVVLVESTGTGTLVSIGAATPSGVCAPAINEICARQINAGGDIATGYADASYLPLSGSAINPTLINAATVWAIVNIVAGGGGNIPGLTVVLLGLFAQNYFTDITVNGTTVITATADIYAQAGGFTIWNWTAAQPMSAQVDYPWSYT